MTSPNEFAVEQHKIPATIFAIAVALVTAGWMLGPRPIGDREARVSVTAREMIASGDYIVPTFNGQQNLAPTPLPYWLTAWAAQFTGHVDAFTVRLPSFIAAVFSVLAIIYFTQRIFEFRTACLASLTWATTFAFVSFARAGTPDMILVTLITIAMLAYYAGLHEADNWRRITYMLTFYIAFALAALTNLFLAIPLVLLPLIGWFIVTKNWRLCKRTLPIVGSIVFLAIFLPWPIMLANRLAEQDGGTTLVGAWRSEFIDRFFIGDNQPAWFYLPLLLEFVAPYIAFVPLAVIAPFYRIWAKRRKPMIFLWCWFFAAFVFLTVLPGKAAHYLLPAIVPAVILAGIILEDIVFIREAHTRRFIAKFFQYHVIIILFGSIIAAAMVARNMPGLLFEAAVLAVSTMVLMAVLTLLTMKDKRYAAAVAVFVGLAVITILTVSLVIIPQARERSTAEVARKAAYLIPPEAPAYAYADISPAFLHNFGRKAPLVLTVDAAYDRYTQDAYIIAADEFADELAIDDRFKTAGTFTADNGAAPAVNKARIFHRLGE